LVNNAYKKIKTILIIFTTLFFCSCYEKLNETPSFDIQDKDLLSINELTKIVGNIANKQLEFENG
jgi:hypothetical protein